MSTTPRIDSVAISDLKNLIQMLRGQGVAKFSGLGMSLDLYPDVGPVPNIEPVIPDAKTAAKEAIQNARRAMDEADQDLFWST